MISDPAHAIVVTDSSEFIDGEPNQRVSWWQLQQVLHETQRQPKIEIGYRLNLGKFLRSLMFTTSGDFVRPRVHEPKIRVWISDPPHVIAGDFSFRGVVGCGSGSAL